MEKIKSGMYGELPKIKIGRYTISMMSNKENETNLWIQHEDGEGGEFKAELIEDYIDQAYSRYF